MKKVATSVVLSMSLLYFGCPSANAQDGNGKDKAIAFVNAVQQGDYETAYAAFGKREIHFAYCSKKYSSSPKFYRDQKIQECVAENKRGFLNDLPIENQIITIPGSIEYKESTGKVSDPGGVLHYFKITYSQPTTDVYGQPIKEAVFYIEYGKSSVPGINVLGGYLGHIVELR